MLKKRKRSLRPIKEANIVQEQQKSDARITKSKGSYYDLDEVVEIPKGCNMVDYDSKYTIVAKSSPDAVRKSLLKNRMHDKKSG